MMISAEESTRRAAAFARIKHSTAMEGGDVPAEAETVITEFIAGRIDEAEMMKRISERFGGPGGVG